MNRAEAMAVLNSAAAGDPDMDAESIRCALIVTGDLEGDDDPPRRVRRAPGTWERANTGLLCKACPFDGLGAR